jgi:hypothetical protein
LIDGRIFRGRKAGGVKAARSAPPSAVSALTAPARPQDGGRSINPGA